MNSHLKDNNIFILVAFVVLLTRIPFLFAGYGSEEDAWGLILVARNINLSGLYEVSRFPGHPVQEFLLSRIWDWPAWQVNLLTALVSSAGILFFMLAMKHLKFSQAIILYSGIALAFTPVFYINSTNIMDYTWALSLVMFAFYLMVTGRYMFTGLVIGIACGFRITAGAMILPFALWHFMNNHQWRLVVKSMLITLVTALICFIPVWNIYGTGFFTYYEYFPYPAVLKNIYKGTVGAWGIFGTLAIAAGLMAASAILISSKRWYSTMISENGDDSPYDDTKPVRDNRPIIWMSLVTIALYTFAFLKIPQKSAFVLPMIPFILLLFAVLLSKKQFLFIATALVVSCFFLGVNLDDPFRGSKASPISFKTKIGQTPVAVDLLSGPVIADYSKRIQKSEYAAAIVNKLASAKDKTVIIAGWWQNELNYFAIKNPNPNVTYLYYANESDLRKYKASDYKIYFLPEQDFYNDLRFKDEFTNSLAAPFP